jgi:ComEC/Rec2-related protein
VSTIRLSLGLLLGVALGSAGPDAALLGASVLTVAGGVTAQRVVCAGRNGRSLLHIALFLIAILRGLSVSGTQDEIRSVPRGSTSPWREVVLDRPGVPGSRCRVSSARHAISLPHRSACDFAAGDRLLVRAAAWRPVAPGPGSSAHSIVADEVLVRRRADARWASWVARTRHDAWERTRGDPAGALTAAVSFGMPTALPPDRRAELRRAGLGHLLAVSGVHVGLLGLWIQALAARAFAFMPRGRAFAIVSGWLPMVGYVALTGAAASATRAAIMIGLIGVADLIGRPHHPTVVLVGCAAGMSLWRPDWIGEPGFQLSFMAMVALLPTPGESPRGPWAATWRITWLLAPLTWWHFGQIAWIGLLTNPIALPVFSLWTLPTALIGWITVGSWGSTALEPARWGAQLILDLARLVDPLPALGPGVAPWLGVVAASGSIMTWVRRSRGAGSRRGRWVPHPLWSGALLVSVVAARPEPVAGWIAVSSRAGEGLLRVDHKGNACVLGVDAVSASRWLALLDAAGASRIAVDPRDNGPRASELRRRLRRAGRLLAPQRCVDAAEGSHPGVGACGPASRGTTFARGPSASSSPRLCWTEHGWRDARVRAPGSRH